MKRSLLSLTMIFAVVLAFAQTPGEDMPTTSTMTWDMTNNDMVVDGAPDEAVWAGLEAHTATGKATGQPVADFDDSDLSCTFKAVYNDVGMYFWIEVTDETLIEWEDGWDDYKPDNIEIFLHSGDYPTEDGAYTDDNSFQIRFKPELEGAENITGRNGAGWGSMADVAENIEYAWGSAVGGYAMEALIKWDLFATKPEDVVYFELAIGDADNVDDLRESILMWNNTDATDGDLAWNNINYFGEVTLSGQVAANVNDLNVNTFNPYLVGGVLQLDQVYGDVQILNVAGQVVKSAQNVSVMDMSGLNNGIYIIKADNNVAKVMR